MTQKCQYCTTSPNTQDTRPGKSVYHELLKSQKNSLRRQDFSQYRCKRPDAESLRTRWTEHLSFCWSSTSWFRGGKCLPGRGSSRLYPTEGLRRKQSTAAEPTVRQIWETLQTKKGGFSVQLKHTGSQHFVQLLKRELEENNNKAPKNKQVKFRCESNRGYSMRQ